MTPKRTDHRLHLLAVLLSLLAVGVLVALSGPRMLPLLIVPAVILLAGLAARWKDSPSGPSDSSDGGGGLPVHPRLPPLLPNGGLPLPDADQASRRLRDHGRPPWTRRRERRAAPSPHRRPARNPARVSGGAQARTASPAA